MENRLAILFGKVVDQERKHPGEEASGHLGASGKGGFRDKRRPGTQAESHPGVYGPIHCPGPADFRAWSHRGPWAGLIG